MRIIGNILIVEDNPASLKSITDLLKHAGYKVRGVTSGTHALRAIEKASADLILMDIRLPDMTGFEVCDKLKADPRFSQIPIIFLTAFIDPATKMKSFRCGGVDYITKPYNEEEVLARVKTHVELHRTKRNLDELVSQRTLALQASQQRYQLLSENVSVGIWHASPDGHGEYINPKLAEISGLTPAEAVGDGWTSTLHPEDCDRVFREWLDFVQGKAPFHSIYRFKRPDGEVRWVIGQAITVYDTAGEITGHIGSITDITERMEIEEKLQQKDYIIESASSAIATTDLDGKMTYANPVFLEMWGFNSLDEFIGTQFTKYWIVEHLLDEIMNVLHSEGKWTREIQARRSDGSVFDVHVCAAMVRDKEGNPVSLMSSSVDITERKQIENELHTTQMHYTDFMNITTDLISYWRMPEGLRVDLPIEKQIDMLYESTYVDGSFESWSNYGLEKKEDVVGKKYKELVEKGFADEQFEYFIKNGYTIDNAYLFEKVADGGGVHALVNWYGTIDNGQLINIWVTAKDITEQKKAEIALKKSEEKFRDFANSVTDIYFAMDSKLNYTFWNAACENILGLEAEKVIGKSWYDFSFNKGYEWIAEKYLNVINTGMPDAFEASFSAGESQIYYVIHCYPTKNGIVVYLQDVTERKHAEEAMRKSAIIIETTSDAVITTDLNGNISFWNKGAEIIYGYKKDELIGQPIKILYKDEDYPILNNMIAELITGNDIPSMELTCIDKNKKDVNILLSLTTLKDSEDKVVELVGITKDITERKKAEKALQLSGERFRSLMEHTDEGFYLFETPVPVSIDLPASKQIPLIYQGSIVECNDAMARMYGFTKAEDIMGKTLAHFHGGTDNPENIAFIREWIETGYRIAGAVSCELDREGNTIWFSNNILGIVENGKLVRTWGTQTDVTERKLAEAELEKHRDQLKEESERMHLAMDAAQMGTWNWNIQEDHVNWSPELLRIFGTNADEFKGTLEGYFQFVVPEMKEEISNIVTDFLNVSREKSIIHYDHEIIRGDGERSWVEVRGTLFLDSKNQPHHMVGICSDISESKNLEEELEKQRTLSARSDRLRSLGEMAAAISHELYQPLGGVRGRAEHLLLAQKRDWDVKPNTMKKNLTDIIESADRMNHIIEHVRLFAREAGKPESSPVNVNDVVLSTVKLVKEQFRSHGVKLKKQLAKVIQMISINPYSLEEVLLNLLTNARDAVEERMAADKAFENPQVSIKTKLIESETVSKMQIVVSDNGVGISDEHMDKLFDPFFTSKGPDKGTGLGLSIVKSIVEQFEGHVSIKSELNKGTKVQIEFPAQQV